MEIQEIPDFRQPETTYPFFNFVSIMSRLYNVPEVRQYTVRGTIKTKHLRYRWGKPLFSYGPKIFLLAPVGSPTGRALSLAMRGDMVRASGYLCPVPMIWRQQKIFTWNLRLGKIEVMGQMPMITASLRQVRIAKKLEVSRRREWEMVREMEARRKRIPEAREIADDILDEIDTVV
jgi:hypothetical protein